MSGVAHAGLFSRLDPEGLGIEFTNFLKRENIRNYLVSGAGLTVGDIDQNGLPDLFLVSQDGPNKLYRQTSPWHFEDVTEAAGIKDLKTWGAGAAFVDFENDGDLDLYVCNKGAYDEIYFNQGDGTFTGSTVGSGDATHRAPTMVSFADYDADGILDFYKAGTRLFDLTEMFGDQVHLVKDGEGNWQADPRHKGQFEVIDGTPREMGTFDHLFRGKGTGKGQPISYDDVTRKAGIRIAREHGLAAIWWDYNNDHFPDLYISNDLHTPDHLYRNNRDGTFTETTEDALPYTSWTSMGSDFADINNDGWLDYLSTDMSATTHFKQKTMMGAMTDTGWFLDHLEPRQYMRNALQVNTGTGKFIDIAFSAGLDSTDWTWSGLFGDLDNDGFEDAFFTNGIERNVQNSDVNILLDKAKREGASEEKLREIFLNGPRLAERNLAFKNLGNLKFQNTSKEWGVDDLTVSHGAVFCDLDRDGDLDLVTNNMNEPVGIYRNNVQENGLLVSLRGTKSNRFGLGARLTVILSDGSELTRLVTSSRGYMSGVEPMAHFGIGNHSVIDSLKVTWPGGATQTFPKLKPGFHYRISEGATKTPTPPKLPDEQLFARSGDDLGLHFIHRENEYDDFAAQPLLPNRLSRFGPALAVGDLDSDGRPDLFFGGAAGQPSQGQSVRHIDSR